MLVTMTLDFDLPRDADFFASVCASLGGQPQAPDVAAPETEAVEPVMTPGAVARKRGRPAKTAVVPLPDAPAPAPVVEQPAPAPAPAPAPVVEQPAPAPAPVAEQPAPAAPSIDLFGENTRHYVEPAPTLDDVKAALQKYFQKDRTGAIALVQSYGVQQFAHVPPEKFGEFIAKCEAAIA